MENQLDSLKLEDARIDASYREKKDSKKPALEGALKGGLASGLLSRIIKPKLRRTEAGLIGGGTMVGGAVGQANHDNSMARKRKAQSLLKNAMYLKKNANIVGNVPVEQKRNNSVLGEAMVGAGVGAAGNALWSGKIPRLKWAGLGAVAGGISGAASGKATEYMANRKKDEKDGSGVSVAGFGAAAGAIDGAVSPMVYRAAGARAKKDGDFSKNMSKEIALRGPEGAFAKTIGSNVDEKAFMSGVNKQKGERLFNRAALKTSAVGMLRGGLIGGGLGFGIDRLSNYLSNKSSS